MVSGSWLPMVPGVPGIPGRAIAAYLFVERPVEVVPQLTMVLVDLEIRVTQPTVGRRSSAHVCDDRWTRDVAGCECGEALREIL